ncbi:unnamed protein product [Rhizoctonia solani]|uniref:Transmembrane protein n=1 Tax=Rhizoctonia solani TaxID=456999 RepID=A0A8H3HMV1_9AGAM|nr:unnamed protein product [Rhizoctonia solani]
MATSGPSSSARPSSTFWIIDTTSVSDTFTTTATFTLWVPLNTPSTTPATTSSSTFSSEPSENPAPRSNAPVIAGSIIGSLLGASLVLTCIIFYYKRRVRRTVQPRTKPPGTPFGSEHALLDLAAEPPPHPENIEPWVAPAVVRRSTKARDEARRDQAWGEGSSALRAEAPVLPRVESASAGLPRAPRVQSLTGSAERPTRPNLQVQEAETQDSSATPGSTNHEHDRTLLVPGPSQLRLHLHQPEALPTGTKSNAVARRRAPREPSPRLEEDAGVSLMRAGDDALPPSYGDLVHNHVPPGPG